MEKSFKDVSNFSDSSCTPALSRSALFHSVGMALKRPRCRSRCKFVYSLPGVSRVIFVFSKLLFVIKIPLRS